MHELLVVPLHYEPPPDPESFILKYMSSISDFLIPYIMHVGNVKADGNCGFQLSYNASDLVRTSKFRYATT